MYTPSALGGHALYTMELMTALSQHACDEHQFELVTSEDLGQDFKTGAYPIHRILPRLPHRKEFSTKAAWAINRILHYPRRKLKFYKWLKGRSDVVGVHFQEYKPWLAGPFFRKLHARGCKIYYTVHNLRPHRYPRGIPKWMIDRWNHNSWNMCDALFVHTELLARELAGLLGDKHPPIYVSPHGTWTVEKPEGSASMQERMKWKKLLFFGTIRRNKGLDLLLDAAESLPGFSITIAGESVDGEYLSGKILPQIERLRAMGIPVEFRNGFTPEAEVAPLFARHSAIVLPYTPEFAAQSGVVFLALAHDLPVVASEVGGLRDLFKEFEIGATFNDITSAGLATAIRNFFERANPDDVTEEIRLAKLQYSWSTAAEVTLAGYGLAPSFAGASR
jgi:glycosyltransferase involved in cell wall biosynthesis